MVSGRQLVRRGVALIEFAVLLPLFLLMFSLYWDNMVELLSKVRDQASAIQIVLNFQNSALRLNYDTSSATYDVKINKLTDTQLIDQTTNPKGILVQLNEMYNSLMLNAGPGAEFVKHAIASEVWYVDIAYSPTQSPPPSGSPSLGFAYSASRGGSNVRFYSQPTEDPECFQGSNRAALMSQFDSFVQSKIQSVLSSPYRFGTKLVDTPSIGSLGIGPIQEYLPYKGILFFMMCSLPPRFYNSDKPVISMFSMIFDKEVSY